MATRVARGVGVYFEGKDPSLETTEESEAAQLLKSGYTLLHNCGSGSLGGSLASDDAFGCGDVGSCGASGALVVSS